MKIPTLTTISCGYCPGDIVRCNTPCFYTSKRVDGNCNMYHYDVYPGEMFVVACIPRLGRQMLFVIGTWEYFPCWIDSWYVSTC